jgi:preprotein translocase subunit Sss1
LDADTYRSGNLDSAAEQHGRQKRCDECGAPLQERDVYTYKEQELCRSCYLGKEELGPMADQYIECPHCGQRLQKFTVVCFNCKQPIREVGKVEAKVKYVGMRILGLVVAFLIYVIAAVALGPMRTERGGSPGIATFMGVFGPLFALVGLFRLLFPMLFKKMPRLGSTLGTALGVFFVILGTLLVVLLPFP